jgi:hypothetical protein
MKRTGDVTSSSTRQDEVNPRFAAFLRGVTIGALVGAAVAGSALWERAWRRREEAIRLSGRDDEAPRP